MTRAESKVKKVEVSSSTPGVLKIELLTSGKGTAQDPRLQARRRSGETASETLDSSEILQPAVK